MRSRTDIMRKSRKFTKKTLERFERENRGKGVKEDFKPWHQVTATDSSSIGRSGRYRFSTRQLHTLSTGEQITILFATMEKSLFDIREQFPLSLNSDIHELTKYDDSYGQFYLGTLEIARKLGVKHPMLRDGSKMPWIMTTDVLLTYKTNTGLKLIAVACKKYLPKDNRTKELLQIEKSYWTERGVEWLLITPEIYERPFAETLRSYGKIALKEANQHLHNEVVEKIFSGNYSYAEIIAYFVSKGYLTESIQIAFWKGFWFGDIPLDIKVTFEPLRKIQLLSKEDFLLKNPILARRSSWNLV